MGGILFTDLPNYLNRVYNSSTMSTIDEVKSRIDIVDLVSEAGVKLRKAGRNYTGFCPFHDNKRTPASETRSTISMRDLTSSIVDILEEL